jgi:DNA-binding NarL/FixJ family response regulator
MFGNKMQILGDKFFGMNGFTASALKEIWAEKCSKYMVKVTGSKFYKDRVKTYKNGADAYMSRVDNVDEVFEIMKEAEDGGLVVPFVDANWDEINNVAQIDPSEYY